MADRWQGVPYSRGGLAVSPHQTFFVTDTGGSGGGFGRGDPHDHLSDVVFWNERVGWACGYGGLFRTDDGGLTWRRIKPRGGWMRVGMAGQEEIWLLEGLHPGGPGRAWLWHSSDNGQTWHEVCDGQVPGYLDFFCQSGEIWILGGWVVPPGAAALCSHDNGRTWRKVDFGGLLIQAWRVSVPGDHILGRGCAVYVLGLGSAEGKPEVRIVRSTDGGRTWSALRLPHGLTQDDVWNFGQLFFATTRDGWLGLSHGRLLVTHDGGDTWALCKLPTDRGVAAIWFDELGRGFVAVDNSDVGHVGAAMYRTLDGGRTWDVVLTGYKNINRIYGLGPNLVWAVGREPTVVPNDIVAIMEPGAFDR
ncbi:MAG: WD40/YVTN/BNR-like repeat-containing protein [Chthonomonadales bacterium]